MVLFYRPLMKVRALLVIFYTPLVICQFQTFIFRPTPRQSLRARVVSAESTGVLLVSYTH